MPKIKHTSKLQDKMILEVKSKNLKCDIFDGIFHLKDLVFQNIVKVLN
jgi:hypothetical protein